MNPRGLEVFVAVADEGSFARAGELLYLSPSGVSGIIRALEGDLDVALFHRHGRGVALTDAGRAMIPHARASLSALAAARGAVRDVTEGLRGRVTLGVMQAMRPPAPDPAALLSSFAASHPGVEVRVRHGGGSVDMVSQVASGRLDLALVGAPSAPSAVHLHELFREPLDLVCATTHPLAGRAAVRLADLADETFAELPDGWGSRVLNTHAFATRGLHRTIRHEINDVATLLSFVAHGLAIAILPRSMAAHTRGTTRLMIEDHPHPFRVSLAASTPLTRPPDDARHAPVGRDLEPAAHALANHLRAWTDSAHCDLT